MDKWFYDLNFKVCSSNGLHETNSRFIGTAKWGRSTNNARSHLLRVLVRRVQLQFFLYSLDLNSVASYEIIALANFSAFSMIATDTVSIYSAWRSSKSSDFI